MMPQHGDEHATVSAKTVVTPTPQSGSERNSFVPLIAGVVLGAAASWLFLLSTLDPYAPYVNAGLYLLLPIIGVCGVALAVALPLVWWRLSRFIAGTRGTLDQVIGEAVLATRAAVDRDVNKAASHAEQAVLATLAWYGVRHQHP